MASLHTIEITESATELKQMLAKQTTPTVRERLQVLYLLKTGKVTTLRDLAKIAGRNISTVYRWLQRYQAGGLEGLLRIPKGQGRKPLIPQPVLEVLQERLKTNHSFHTYRDIQTWLKQEYGIDASYKVVHETVRYRLKVHLKATLTSSPNEQKSYSP